MPCWSILKDLSYQKATIGAPKTKFSRTSPQQFITTLVYKLDLLDSLKEPLNKKFIVYLCVGPNRMYMGCSKVPSYELERVYRGPEAVHMFCFRA